MTNQILRRGWTQHEYDFIMDHPEMPHRDQARVLGRTSTALSAFKCRVRDGTAKIYTSLKTAPRQSGKKWTEEDNDYLRMHYTTMSLGRIASKLKRTENSCRIQAIKLRIAVQELERLRNYTITAWAKYLGLSRFNLNQILWRRQIAKKHDRVARRYIITEDMMEAWLRKGNALRCNVNPHTPIWLARLINDVKQEFISYHELVAIDDWLAPSKLQTRNGMVPMKIQGLLFGHGTQRNRTWHYRKSDIYALLYNLGRDIPRNIKDPHIRAIWLAWDSVYVTTWEIEKYFRVRSKSFPKNVCYGVYNRSEVVAWLRTRPRLQIYAQSLRQDVITWQEIHADIARKKRNGQML